MNQEPLDLQSPEFLKKLQKRNKDAFHQLYEHYKLPLYRIVNSMVKNREKTADIIQDTFITVIKKIHQLEEINKLKYWLFRIAVNRTLNVLHREKRVSFAGDDLEMLSDQVTRDDFQVRDSKEYEEMHGVVLEMVERLPLKQRVVFNLKYNEDFKEAEIAEIIGIPVGTVKSRLNIARGRIKQWVKVEYIDPQE